MAKIGRPKQTEGTPVHCDKCDNDWRTLSEARYIHCSVCQKMIRNPRYKERTKA
jgi:ribosomal protein S27E